ncbi:hypothetical protein EDC04DRAFT_2905555 [Pisolithus marmoratus]|nr:hypothetical protein EDC04DRAFT_2905555 [Pisolithus marmoratus]
MPPKKPNVMCDQARLSEQLQLLDQLYSHPRRVGQHGSNLQNVWTSKVIDDIHALDTITVTLATGTPGEVFAAAFDKRQGFTLVLAKNTRVTTEDDKAICDLVTAITSSSSANANDVLSLLFPRCRTNIVQRIMKLHEVVTAFSDDLETVLKRYHPANFVDEEFPNSAEYQIPTSTLGQSRACQYYYGIPYLIDYAKRCFPHGINHRWVAATADTEENTIVLDADYLEAVSRALDRRLSEGTVATLRHRFPDMEARWRNSLVLMTRVHPEILIMLDLSTPFNSLDLRYQQPIGSNKRACMCCTIWIRTCNLQFGARWLMSRNSGKADPTWAFPDCSYEHAIAWDGKSTVNEAVQHEVQRCLTTSLYSLIPVLSDPENNKAKAIWDVMKMRCDCYLKDAVDCGKLLMKRIIKPLK